VRRRLDPVRPDSAVLDWRSTGAPSQRLRRRLAACLTACLDHGPCGRLVHVWSAGSPASGLSAWELACHARLTTVFAGERLSALPVDDRHRPSQTMATGTQRARCTPETIWMQTVGTALLAVNRCSPARVWATFQDSRSAHGLLYLAAVRDDRREQEHCQSRVDIGSASLMAPEAVDRQRS
jgi:hypothetical protein